MNQVDKMTLSISQVDQQNIQFMVQRLENFDKDKAIKKGLLAAGRLLVAGGRRRLRDRMKSGAQGVTGNLLASFSVKVKRNKLGMLAGFRQGKDGGSHAYLIDGGTHERYQYHHDNKYVGRVKANYFWSDTKEQDYTRALDALYQGIEKAVERISNRNL